MAWGNIRIHDGGQGQTQQYILATNPITIFSLGCLTNEPIPFETQSRVGRDWKFSLSGPCEAQTRCHTQSSEPFRWCQDIDRFASVLMAPWAIVNVSNDENLCGKPGGDGVEVRKETREDDICSGGMAKCGGRCGDVEGDDGEEEGESGELPVEFRRWIRRSECMKLGKGRELGGSGL